MTLKEQIEKTIEIYQKACNYKNLNYEHCNKNYIHSGLCLYTSINGFYKLNDRIQDNYFCYYITETPDDIFYSKKKYFKKIRLYKAHQKRIKYLQNLLTNIQK
jgi:hypothetical protein